MPVDELSTFMSHQNGAYGLSHAPVYQKFDEFDTRAKDNQILNDSDVEMASEPLDRNQATLRDLPSMINHENAPLRRNRNNAPFSFNAQAP